MNDADRTVAKPSERQLVAAVRRLGRRAEAHLGDRPLSPDSDPSALSHVVRRITASAIDALHRHGEHQAGAAELRDIAVTALGLERELRRHDTDREARRRTELERCLARFRAIGSSAELVERICEEAAGGCGLRRVILSRVRDGVWSPWKIYDTDAPPAAGPEWLSTTAIAVEDMPLESAVIDGGRAATVHNAAGDPRVHQPLSRLAGFESFVVAPIAPAGVVLGLLHGDRPAEPRSVDDDDRRLLSALAEGVGRIYERVTTLERFEAQRRVVREAQDATDSIMSSLHGEIELVQLVGRSHSPTPPNDEVPLMERRTAFDAQLTQRERDILALMIQGEGNDAIAEQLAVTRSTVKSHVRSILRKIGAVNRAEAISRYHGM